MIALGQWLLIFLNTTHSKNTIYIYITETGVLSKKRLYLHVQCEIFSDILSSILRFSHLLKTMVVKNYQIYFTIHEWVMVCSLKITA